MKKYFKLAFIYAIIALVCGVFYREFTKYNGFTGRTMLGFSHVHFFALGTMFYLLVALLVKNFDVEKKKSFKVFMIAYNIGLPFMVIMFIVRGIFEVLETSLSTGASAAIAGVAGIAHIIITVGIVAFFIAFIKKEQTKEITE